MNINNTNLLKKHDVLEFKNNSFDKVMAIGITSLVSILPTILALPYAEGKIINLLMVQTTIAVCVICYDLIKE